MSSFRLICVAALTVAMWPAVNAAAQIATATDQSGKRYLAGLRPPHDRQMSALKTSRVTEAKPAAKSTRVAIKQKPVAIAKSKHRPVRLADKINSRVAWPSVEPGADERTTPDSALQFATEDTTPNPAAAHPAVTAPPAAAPKIVPPAKIVANDAPKINPVAADTTPTASTPVQTERFEAPPSTQMRVVMPAPNAELLPAPAPIDRPTNSSETAQLLASLAGATTAAFVAWLMFGLGSSRIARSRQV